VQDTAAAAATVRKEALTCCMQVIAALENWAKPIKDAALRAAESAATPAHVAAGAQVCAS
jgi:hypothetical protein